MKPHLLRLALTLCLIMPFLLVSGADYYWIGGSGNWSDLSHWVTTSGGSVGHIQVPTADDDVYFDLASFAGTTDIVTVNSDNVFFKNMNWDPAVTGVTLQGGRNVTMSVYGALVLSPGMNHDFEGSILFNSTESEFQEITAHGFRLANDVLFDSQIGKWNISSDFSVDSLFRIQDGIIFIEPNITITTKFVEAEVENEASLLLEGDMIVTGNDFQYLNQPRYTIDINATNFILTTSTASTVELTGEMASIFLDGDGSTLFNNLDFSNPSGIASIQSEPTVQTAVNRVRYFSNGYTKGNVQLMELVLTSSKSYSWEPGYNYNIEIFTALGSCSAPITIQSSIPGEFALFNNSSGAIGPVTGEYLNIRDIHVSSGDFEVNNSLDLGNTDGWIINERTGTDLYWVGGNGDWNDAMHWAMMSGGVGGACIPSANDNVFFDANSFNAGGQTVNLNVDDAFCNSMDWTGATGNPSFESNTMNIHVNGSLTLISNMNLNFSGDVFFESNGSGNSIATAGNIFQGDAWFTGAGEWVLADDFEIERAIRHNAGTFNTNNFTVVLTDYRSESDQARTLILGSSRFELRWISGNGPEFVIRGALFNIDSGTSTMVFTSNGYLSLINTQSLEFNRVLFFGYGGIGNYENLGNTVNESRFKYVESYIWGDFGSELLLDTLKAQPGSRVLFNSYGTITVAYLNAQGTCAQPINIVSNFTGQEATVETNNSNSDISYAYIQDIHVVGTGSFSATNSVDLENNVGWIIDGNGARTLFWVGNAGEWNDPAHWSLSSGGTGGECIPTPEDDVIFDEMSFLLPDQRVDGGFCFFKNMTWADIDETAKINWDRTFAYGSIYLSDLVDIDRWNGISLDGSQLGSELDLKGKQVGFFELIADTGEWTLISDIKLFDSFNLISGEVHFGDVTVDIGRMFVSGFDSNLRVFLEEAEIYIRGENSFNPPFVCYADSPVDFDPGTSNIYLTNATTGFRLNAVAIPLHNVRATDPNGVATIIVDNFNSISGVFNKVQFDGDAIIDGVTIIDSLILAPGKSYQLKSGVAQTINSHLQIVGNNCSSIELTSTQVGIKADIDINSFEVIGDFIQMRDIRINNSISSYAGIHSTDIGNSNIGWIFEDAPNETNEEQGFFGDDQVLCTDATIQLVAYPFNANATFQWQDNSTESTLDIDMPGAYWARVTFDGGCSIIDTIQVLPQEDFAVVLGNDTTLCEAEILLLDVSVAGASYNWQDGSDNATFSVTAPGEYIVDVNLGGCSIQDSIMISYVSFAAIDLGMDQTICENDDISFDVTVSGGNYMWQDNSTQPIFTTGMAGKYYVDVTRDNCTATDTIVIAITALANVDLGNDTTICDGLNLELSTTVLANSYLWSNNNTTSGTSLPAGKHYLDLTLDGCIASDTIEIFYKPYPSLTLGADTTLCTGETLPLNLAGAGDSYLWNDGSDMETYDVDSGGRYDVIVGLDGCVAYDTITIGYSAFPLVDFGDDMILCEGESVSLIVTSAIATDYEWQDASTTNMFDASITGTYMVNVYNGRCRSADTINLQFNPRPIFDLGADKIQCLGEALDLDATVVGATYGWSDGSDMATNSFDAQGDFWLDVTLEGCTVRDSILLRYVQIPDASLGRDTVLCEGDFLSYDFSNLNLSFEWSDMSGDPTNTIGEAGTFWLEVTDRDCSSRDSITLLYKPAPTVNLGRDTMLCTGEMITLSLIVANDEMVTWSDNSMGDMLVIENSGSFSVTVDKAGCIVNDEIIITFNDPPAFDLGSDTLICEQQPLVLRPGISGASYRWQDGSSETTYTADRPGTYEVEVTRSGCSTTDIIEIDTRTCTFYRAYLPEAFSPDGDGVNDTYQPGFSNELQIHSYSMTVYDRWGNQLFISEDPLIGWDGTFQQKRLNRGIYVYAIAIEYEDDRGHGSKLQRGEVFLMR